jgi:hypothetical protein
MGDSLVLVEYLLYQFQAFGWCKSCQLYCASIDLAALLRHGLDRRQLMSGREKLAQEPLRILVHVGHDTLLQQADFTCDLADHFCCG